MSVGAILFSFEGRLSRLPFWLAVLAMVILAPVALVALYALTLVSPLAALAFAVAFCLPMLWVALAIGTKRLHDGDRSAGWLLAFYLLPSLLAQMAGRMAASPGEQTGALGVAVVAALLVVWGVVVLGFQRGTPGPNRFGPDPLGAATTGLIEARRHGNEEHALS